MNKVDMNFYHRLNASFWCKNVEYPLYAVGIEEDDDSVTVLSQVRHPEVERGCIGNLILTGVNGHNFNGDEVELNDGHHNILLAKIQVYSADLEECPTWRYVFLKD